MCDGFKPINFLEKFEKNKSFLELDETCKKVKIVIFEFCKGKILEDPRAELIALYLCLHLRLQLVDKEYI